MLLPRLLCIKDVKHVGLWGGQSTAKLGGAAASPKLGHTEALTHLGGGSSQPLGAHEKNFFWCHNRSMPEIDSFTMNFWKKMNQSMLGPFPEVHKICFGSSSDIHFFPLALCAAKGDFKRFFLLHFAKII